MKPDRCETNKLYVARLEWRKAPEFRKLEIFENIEVGDWFGHPNRSIFFAGANFIALRRRGSYFKCLVEWLHRRGIAPAGAIAYTNALANRGHVQPLDQILLIEINGSRKSFLPIQRQYL